MITAALEDATPLVVHTAKVKLDDNWSPYAEATLKVDPVSGVDPTVGHPRLVVTLTQTGYTRTLDLGIQTRTVNQDGTMTLEACSDEIRLHEYGRVNFDTYTPGTGSLRELVADTLMEVLGADLDPEGPNAVIDPESYAWAPGQSAHEFINGPIQAAGLRLWCDEDRVWRLQQTPQPRSGQVVVDYFGDNMTAFSALLSRDNWYDSVVLTYKWTDILGDSYVAHDLAAVPGYSKTYHHTYDDTPFPGAGRAAVFLRQFLTKGTTIPTTAFSDYTATPGMTAIINTPDSGYFAGWIESVTWHDDGLMDIDARDIVEVTDHAWVFGVPGVSWLDVPAGVDWSEDL